MLQSRKSFVKDKYGTESPTYLWPQVVYNTAGSCRKPVSALSRRHIEVVRTGGYSIALGPLGVVFKKKKRKGKKRLLSIASASSKHTDGERGLSKDHVHRVLVCHAMHRY